MKDLTILYITANVIDDYFANNVRKQLTDVAGDFPIISISHKPINFGKNICVGDKERSAYTIYENVLVGAKEAKTDYVGIAEDDVLYSPDHFTCFRPPMDTFAYNVNKWSLFTWTDPQMFSFRRSTNNTSLIAPREALIDALEERYSMYDRENYPKKYWGEVGRYQRQLKVSKRKTTRFWSFTPNVVFSHEDALGFKGLGKRKRHAFVRAYEVPYWGRAEEVAKLWRKSTI